MANNQINKHEYFTRNRQQYRLERLEVAQTYREENRDLINMRQRNVAPQRMRGKET